MSTFKQNDSSEYKLTELSHGGGCGCKMSPHVLRGVLDSLQFKDPSAGKLIVGNEGHDDAAVYDLGNDQGLISTTDFFMPIVDDPFEFGRIAACNAISDVYAMGGTPILALALMALPIGKLGPQVFKKIMEGALAICQEAGVALAGGHSIDSVEPIFGLAVNGLVPLSQIKTNKAGQEGDLLILTKPLGIGALAHAIKKKIASPQSMETLLKSTTMLNKAGRQLAQLKGVHAMTDVTGFGLLGHAFNIARGSQLDIEINWSEIPIHAAARELIAQGCIPGGSMRNWESYLAAVHWQGEWNLELQNFAKNVLSDPQTSGGILFSCDPSVVGDALKVSLATGLFEAQVIGKLTAKAAGLSSESLPKINIKI